MKLRRRRQDPFMHHADEDARLGAQQQRLEAEQADLDASRERLARDRALAKHLGEGDLDQVVERESAVEVRLGEVAVALGEIVTARHEVARRAVANATSMMEDVLGAKRKAALEVQVEVGQLAEQLQAARSRLATAQAASQDAEAALEEVKRDKSALAAAIEEGRSDPLVAIRERRVKVADEQRQARIKLYRAGELSFDDLTDRERRDVKESDKAQAAYRAERVRISKEAGSYPVTVEEAEARATGGQVEDRDAIPAHVAFPRLRK